MHKKITLLVLVLFFIPFVMSAPPQQNDNGLEIRTGLQDYIKFGQYYDVHAHVFLQSDGTYVTDATCYFHLYNANGTHLLTLEDNTPSNNFDYGFDIYADNVTERGHHLYILQCNNTVGVDAFGGYASGEIVFNDYGEELTTANALNFNFSMVFLMILFVLGLVGIFYFDNVAGKLASYWVAHLLFVVGTFSVWQFTQGFAIAYAGLSGVFRILFYVSITATFPMVLLSVVLAWWNTMMGDEVQRLMGKGFDEDTATKKAKNRRGKW